MEAPSAPITSRALGWIVRVERVWLPSWASHTITSSAPPARKPSTAALISPVSNWRNSGSLGSVCSCRQIPPTPSASVIRNTVFFCADRVPAAHNRIISHLMPLSLPFLVFRVQDGNSAGAHFTQKLGHGLGPLAVARSHDRPLQILSKLARADAPLCQVAGRSLADSYDRPVARQRQRVRPARPRPPHDEVIIATHQDSDHLSPWPAGCDGLRVLLGQPCG